MSEDLRDCYRMLELDAGATPEAVKRSYRDLVKLWHPDRYSPGSPLQKKAEEKLKEINLAYERILKRPPASQTDEPAPKSAHAAPSMAEEPAAKKRHWSDDDDAEATRPAGAPPASEPPPAAAADEHAPKPVSPAARAARHRPWRRPAGRAVAAVALLALAVAAWRHWGAGRSATRAPAAAPDSPPAAAEAGTGAPDPGSGEAAPTATAPAAPAGVQTGAPALPGTPAPAANRIGSFTIGSTKSEVIAVQGTPDAFTANSFQYGSAVVTFRNDRVESWQDGTPALKVRVESPEMAAKIGYFTVGSTRAQVIEVQGQPDSFTPDQFQYGSSTVRFRDDRVASWHNAAPPLRARLFVDPPSAPLAYFAVGSTRAEVVAAQGPPERTTPTTYQYGSSLVSFRDDRVVSWQDGSPPLHVRPQRPLPARPLGSFTIGSSKDEVVAVQGLPDNFTPTEFHYGTSAVFFKGDLVIGWQGGTPPLKTRPPGAPPP